MLFFWDFFFKKIQKNDKFPQKMFSSITILTGMIRNVFWTQNQYKLIWIWCEIYYIIRSVNQIQTVTEAKSKTIIFQLLLTKYICTISSYIWIQSQCLYISVSETKCHGVGFVSCSLFLSVTWFHVLVISLPQVSRIYHAPLLSCLACLSVYLNLCVSVVGWWSLLHVGVFFFLVPSSCSVVLPRVTCLFIKLLVLVFGFSPLHSCLVVTLRASKFHICMDLYTNTRCFTLWKSKPESIFKKRFLRKWSIPMFTSLMTHAS